MKKQVKILNTPLSSEEILADFRLASLSRHLSIIGRREVLSGKAKFGIFGDGKERLNIECRVYFSDIIILVIFCH